MESVFLELFGLPMHPLVVHAAVVLIPLSSLLVLAGAIFYRRFPVVLGVGVITSWVAAISAVLSVQSGEALGEEIGSPQPHGEWGEILGPLSLGFTVVATATWWLRRRRVRIGSLVGTLLIMVATPAVIVLTVLVGHSGAYATWSGVLEQPAVSTAEPEATRSYTLDDVAARDTIDNCWIAVDGVVYDVSGFGPSHPGGEFAIERICGTDATEAFRGQHGTSGSPNSTLAGFDIGVLN